MAKKIFEYGEEETQYLKSKDKKLGRIIDAIGPIEREMEADLFISITQSVISQQISGSAARTVKERLHMLLDGVITPQTIQALPVQAIKQCGMSMRKASYIKNIADAAVSSQVDFDTLPMLSDADFITQLTSIKGVGVWTAEMMLIFSRGRKNILSYGDFAIRKGIMLLYGHKELPRERFLRYHKRYAPYASVASLYLWALSGQ